MIFAGLGLAGLRGFFDRIHCCVDGYLGQVELESHDDRLHAFVRAAANLPADTPSAFHRVARIPARPRAHWSNGSPLSGSIHAGEEYAAR